MLCSNCGKQSGDKDIYCPFCGKMLSEVPTDENESKKIVSKKKMPLWFKICGILAVLALVAVTAGILFTESIVDVIDDQLTALRESDVTKAYYAYSSKEFQSTTSLEEFKQFVNTFPIFLENSSSKFLQRSLEDHIAFVEGTITSKEHMTTPIEYRLIKEDNKWKILSIRLLKPESVMNAKYRRNTSELIEITKDQLEAIQEKNFAEAYKDYTSKEFQQATNEEDFEKFIQRYPILINHDVISFHSPSIKYGIGALSVILHSDEVAAYIKYHFTFENNDWKVSRIKILSPNESEEPCPEIKKLTDKPKEPTLLQMIKAGTQVDLQGNVTDPKTEFSGDVGDLYINVLIKHGIKECLITLQLQNTETGVTITDQTRINENGESVLLSIFSPPASGWPKGHYHLLVTSSNGSSTFIDFDIQ